MKFLTVKPVRARLAMWIALALVTVASVGCKPRRPPVVGHIVVAVTIDWEGAYIDPDGLDALDEVRSAIGPVPLTHFISAGYFAKPKVDPTALPSIVEALRPGDELALHLHGWKSLALAAAITPRLSPSFLTGTDQLLVLDDGDVGFDLDLDAYSVADLRALVRTSRTLLAQTHVKLSTTFRAGGYLGTPKVLEAIRAEGFMVDSSATDYRQLDEREASVLRERIHKIWPTATTVSQPYMITTPAGPVLEMPVAAFADYATTAEMVAIVDAAHARLHGDPTHDVFVVLGFHQETAQDFGKRLSAALRQVQARPELAAELQFSTVEAAAARALGVTSP